MKKLLAFLLLLAAIGGLCYSLTGNSVDFCGAVGELGYRYDPRAKAAWLRELGNKATLQQINPAIFANDVGEVFLYRPVQKVKPNHFPLNQSNIGSCVSFGFGAGCDVLLAEQVCLGQSDHFQPCVEESIYGGARVEAAGQRRAGGGDGANCSYAAKYLNKWGVLFRQNYPDLGLDLSVYSVPRCREWGDFGQGGRDEALKPKIITLCKQHPVRQVAYIRNNTDLVAAIKAGYPVIFGSSLLPSSSRDSNGFASIHGGGGHCQAMIGYRKNPEGILVQNSWGKFNSGGKYPDDQPDGSYWVTMRDAGRLVGSEAYALSDEVGFPIKDISKLNRVGW